MQRDSYLLSQMVFNKYGEIEFLDPTKNEIIKMIFGDFKKDI